MLPILSRIAGIFQSKMRVSLAHIQNLGQAIWMKRDARVYATEGYSLNTIVYRCVDIISKSVASIPLKVQSLDGKDLPAHPVALLLARPNAYQAPDDFIQAVVAFRLITGNSYLEAIQANPKAPPKELWVWPPYQVRVVPPGKDDIGGGWVPRAYAWEDGATKVAWDVDPINGACSFFHWKTFTPSTREADKWFGMSPLMAAAMAVDTHNSGSNWNKSLLDNYCAPPGALTTEGTLTEGQFGNLKKEIDEQYSGAKNARRPMLLEGGLKWQTLALSPAEMDFLEGRNVAGREIAAAFGVPTQVIPLQGDQTFANYEQARLALWEDTVIPLTMNLCAALGHWLATLAPGMPAFKIVPDLDQVPALAPRRSEKWATVGNAAFLTINEKREALGYDKVPEAEADQIMVDAGKLPLGFSVDLPQGADLGVADDSVVAEADKALKRLLKGLDD